MENPTHSYFGGTSGCNFAFTDKLCQTHKRNPIECLILNIGQLHHQVEDLKYKHEAINLENQQLHEAAKSNDNEFEELNAKLIDANNRIASYPDNRVIDELASMRSQLDDIQAEVYHLNRWLRKQAKAKAKPATKKRKR